MFKFPLEKLMIASILVLALLACGSDDEVITPDDTELIIALSFSAQNPPVNVPGPLNASNNQRAKEIVDILRSANAITLYDSYFNVPDDAQISKTPVAGSTFQSANTTVYSWIFNDGSQFVNTAYQISEVEGDHKFEIYFDYGDGLAKSLEGKESSNELHNGFLLDYGLNGSNQVQLDYQWSESSSLGFNISLVNAGRHIEIKVEADNSGSAEVFIDNIPSRSYKWNGAGTSGTYTEYDSNGIVSQSGEWAG
jgi:hypothetical protein